jgi:MATE family multidrug resistance protein
MWPVMLANMSLPLLGLVDTAVLGHLEDSIYLAGVALGASLIVFVFLGFNFLAMGLSGFTSQAKGANDPTQIRTQLAQYSLVAGGLSILVLLAQAWLIEFGLAFMQASDAASAEANIYLNIRIWGVPAQIFNSMLLGFFVGLQNTRISLVTVSVAHIVNLILNITLVYGFGMTTDGIALGTVISEYIALTLVLFTLWRALNRLPPGLDKHRLRTLKAYSKIFSVSFSLFIRTFLLLMGFAWFTRLSAAMGDSVLAANAVLLAFLTVISNSLDASAAAAEAQVGLAIGQHNPERLKEALWTTGWCAFGLALALALIFGVLGNAMLALLTSQQDLRQQASAYLPWVAVLPVIAGLAYWLDGVFIGARQTAQMRNGVMIGFISFVLLSQVLPATNQALWLSFSTLFAARSLWMLYIYWRRVLPLTRLTDSHSSVSR